MQAGFVEVDLRVGLAAGSLVVVVAYKERQCRARTGDSNVSADVPGAARRLRLSFRKGVSELRNDSTEQYIDT